MSFQLLYRELAGYRHHRRNDATQTVDCSDVFWILCSLGASFIDRVTNFGETSGDRSVSKDFKLQEFYMFPQDGQKVDPVSSPSKQQKKDGTFRTVNLNRPKSSAMQNSVQQRSGDRPSCCFGHIDRSAKPPQRLFCP